MGKQRPKYSTPVGSFLFCNVDQPDTKFAKDSAPEGYYRASIKLKTGSPEQVKFQEMLEKILEEHVERVCQEKNKKRHQLRIEESDYPWKPEVDKEGEETGYTIYKTKLAAKVVLKSGESWEQKPKVFDASAQLIPQPPGVGAGSEGRLSGQVDCWFYTGKVGISLWFEGMMITKLVEGYSESQTADDFGFDAVEGGYTTEGAFEDAVAGEGGTDF